MLQASCSVKRSAHLHEPCVIHRCLTTWTVIQVLFVLFLTPSSLRELNHDLSSDVALNSSVRNKNIKGLTVNQKGIRMVKTGKDCDGSKNCQANCFSTSHPSHSSFSPSCSIFVFLYLQEVQAFPVSPQVRQAQEDPEEQNGINIFQYNDFNHSNVIILCFVFS